MADMMFFEGEVIFIKEGNKSTSESKLEHVNVETEEVRLQKQINDQSTELKTLKTMLSQVLAKLSS
ncbi:MAG: hypothetical protein CL532_06155 [Aestuariivita sp.]|nr:hypothetical protein [Aestuariivita sp.]|tara:strand:- start:46 stop:243 length:198 start_codon:yes stop_codon:yes gene_type:complete